MRRGTFVRSVVASAALLVGEARGTDAPPPAAPPAVATVNGEPITLAEVDAVIGRRPAGVALPAAALRELRAEAASDLVDELLLKQFLRKHGPAVEAAEIDRHFKALAESLAKQGKTPADFFREAGQTEAQARESLATTLQLSRYVAGRVTDEQLKQYHAANRDHFDRVEVRVSHVVLRVGKDAPPAEREAARRKLVALKADVAAKLITFADAARKHSHCPSAPEGGDLGPLVRKGTGLDEAFCKAAFALPVGEVSDVVETGHGLHLLLVTARKPGTPSAFEACAGEVRESFADEFRTDLVAKLRKQARVSITLP